MSAPDFLDVLHTIFDGRDQVLGGIVNGLVDILDISDDRKANLLKRWQDMRLGVNMSCPTAL